jgi:hypothetical protein
MIRGFARFRRKGLIVMLEETQQHADQGSTGSKTHHRVSSKDVTLTDKVQIHPPRGPDQNDMVIALARVVCVGVAVFSYATTHELVSFLILIGIAIDPGRVWDAIKLVTPKPHPATKGPKKRQGTPENGEDKEE